MKKNLYSYFDYKKLVLDKIQSAKGGGRGLRKVLSEAIGCQTPFVTQVLSGNSHFSLEQAEACARWMGLSSEEMDFFLLLVSRQRAGTRSLERHLTQRILLIRQQRLNLKRQLDIKPELTQADEFVYYGSWLYSALHMVLLNPKVKTLSDIQKLLMVPTTHLLGALEFLVARGLVKKEDQKFRALSPLLHLKGTSPMIAQHHTNWRVRALDSIAHGKKENLHYSGVISLSKSDFAEVKEKISLLLREIMELVQASKDEKVACLGVDWFELFDQTES